MSTDAELLRRYVQQGAQDAFAELVRRHVDLAYAAAVRRTNGNRVLAEDATQQAFIALARHAPRLTEHPTLAGWLYVAARHAAGSAMRGEKARQVREQETHAMQSSHESEPNWQELRPELDQVIEQLDPRERDVIVLRFFENRRFSDIGSMLSVSEDAARMRVERALEKLRALLSRRGITSTAAALGTALASQPALAAPSGLAASATAAAFAATPGAPAIAGVSIFMSTTKAVLTFVAVLAIGTAAFLVVQHRTNAGLQGNGGRLAAPVSGTNPVLAAQTDPGWRKSLAADSAALSLPAQPHAPTADASDAATAGPWFRGMVRIDDWKDRGTDTPAAAFETYVWAGDHVDIEARAKALGFGTLKSEVDAFYARLSPEVRARYDSPEKLWAALMAAAPQAAKITAFQVLAQTPNPVADGTTVTLRVRTQNERGFTYEGDVLLERSDSGWRRSLPANLVTPLFDLFSSAKPPTAGR
jgi:RNA polymerase sigma factor (sigma-70 family)